MGVAAIAKAPELELDEDDAKKLGEATAAVLAFYKVKMTPKQEAYGLLLEAAAQVYPPMVVSLYVRLKMEAEEKKKGQQVGIQPSFKGSEGAVKGGPVYQSPPKPVLVPTPQPVNVQPGGFDPRNIKLDN